MIRYLKGDLLSADAEAYVNTVNTVGIMGKGIALQFKGRFPANYKAYRKASKAEEVQIGKMLVVRELTVEKEVWIINFPTKVHWKSPSKLDYIRSGLEDLRRVILEKNIGSIAIPPLGCGLGGLNWPDVKHLIQQALGNMVEVDIQVFEPNATIKNLLKSQDYSGTQKLTPARAMLLYALFFYEQLGEPSSLFAANKLAYFLQRTGEKLKLNFVAHLYGPYSNQVEHILQHLSGTYIRGLEQNSAKAFEPLQLNYSAFPELKTYIETELGSEQRERLERLMDLVSGFQSGLSLEILATVDFIKQEKGTDDPAQIVAYAREWSKRKSELITEEYVTIALKRLSEHGQKLSLI